MYAAYERIFRRCGLDFRAVEADTGAIGGSGCRTSSRCSPRQRRRRHRVSCDGVSLRRERRAGGDRRCNRRPTAHGRRRGLGQRQGPHPGQPHRSTKSRTLLGTTPGDVVHQDAHRPRRTASCPGRRLGPRRPRAQRDQAAQEAARCHRRGSSWPTTPRCACGERCAPRFRRSRRPRPGEGRQHPRRPRAVAAMSDAVTGANEGDFSTSPAWCAEGTRLPGRTEIRHDIRMAVERRSAARAVSGRT
jgi:hypothetical protein